LLLQTTYGLSDDEAQWMVLSTWASFQPRRVKQRLVPGQLYYPAEYSQVFEKYWDYLPDLSQHPGFVSESPCCQEQMSSFSSTFSTMDLRDFQPLVTAEAKQSDVETVKDAAISRLRQIPGESLRSIAERVLESTGGVEGPSRLLGNPQEE
jgi:hypothetical protein